ncbi:MAG TPA: c-type cytochrome [Phototrophicaceae bacterium]|nr:c-type cytochrome [Phototrophicaceae bacterium]
MRFLLLLAAGLVLAGCGGLAGEPRIVSSLPPATPAPTDVGHPLTPPDIAAGAALFAQNCVQCHGAAGKGDGTLVQSGQVKAPPDFTNPATMGGQRPDEWFTTITNGNVAALMPPWGNALSEEQRWDVAYYTYTLAETQQQIAQGKQVFTTDCAVCDTSAFTDLSKLATTSQDALVQQIAQMTPFKSLSAADQQVVAAYVRTLALANADHIGAAQATVPVPNATEEVGALQAPNSTAEVGSAASTSVAAPNITSVNVVGKVTNGTAGSTIPADLKLTLFTFDANLAQKQYAATASADGSFTFSSVPFDPNSTYVATTSYRNQVFASALLSGDALAADAADGTLNLPITIYELTEDSDVVQISGLVTQVSVVGDSMQVAQVFNFTNTSDRAFITSQTASNGEPVSLLITLPPGAVIAGFTGSDQNRYIVDQDHGTVFDTLPVLPKEQHIVQLVYLIPYSSNDAIIEQQLNYVLNGQVRLLVSPTNMQVTSQQLPPMGAQTVGDTSYQSYGGQVNLAASDVIRYEISGTGLATAVNPNTSFVSANNLLPLLVGAMILIALLGGGIYVVTSRNRSGDQQVINILVRQIAELDADHDAGKIADTAYEQQRAALKARLTSLMERKKQ